MALGLVTAKSDSSSHILRSDTGDNPPFKMHITWEKCFWNKQFSHYNAWITAGFSTMHTYNKWHRIQLLTTIISYLQERFMIDLPTPDI